MRAASQGNMSVLTVHPDDQPRSYAALVMGENPNLTAIRLFTAPEGWVAHFSGNDIARRFPKLEQFVAEYA